MLLAIHPGWIQSHEWLVPVLWTLAAAFGIAAVICSPWARKRLASRTSSDEESEPRQHIVGSGNRTAGRDYREEIHHHYGLPKMMKEVPTGVKNGVNQVFMLSHTPNPPESLEIFFNGEKITYWCLVSGREIRLNYHPQLTDHVEATYMY